MSFAEIDFAGVLVSPVAVVVVAGWLVAYAVRTFLNRWGLLRYVWHPALFVFAVFIVVVSSVMLWASSP